MALSKFIQAKSEYDAIVALLAQIGLVDDSSSFDNMGSVRVVNSSGNLLTISTDAADFTALKTAVATRLASELAALQSAFFTNYPCLDTGTEGDYSLFVDANTTYNAIEVISEQIDILESAASFEDMANVPFANQFKEVRNVALIDADFTTFKTAMQTRLEVERASLIEEFFNDYECLFELPTIESADSPGGGTVTVTFTEGDGYYTEYTLFVGRTTGVGTSVRPDHYDFAFDMGSANPFDATELPSDELYFIVTPTENHGIVSEVFGPIST